MFTGSAGNTRIDMALHLAQTDMFTAANGGRSDKPDLLIVILEGEQSVIAQNTGNNKQIGEQIRAKGIKMFVVGIGANVQASSLKDIAGGTYNYIHAADWNELTNEEFIGKCLDMACRGRLMYSLSTYTLDLLSARCSPANGRAKSTAVAQRISSPRLLFKKYNIKGEGTHRVVSADLERSLDGRSPSIDF